MGMRLERFGPEAQQVVAGQIGPLANLRSSSGCAVVLRTDSPIIELHLARLRHHQPVPVQVALQWQDDAGAWRTVTSSDLRIQEGTVDVWLPTGLSGRSTAGCLDLVAQYQHLSGQWHLAQRWGAACGAAAPRSPVG